MSARKNRADRRRAKEKVKASPEPAVAEVVFLFHCPGTQRVPCVGPEPTIGIAMGGAFTVRHLKEWIINAGWSLGILAIPGADESASSAKTALDPICAVCTEKLKAALASQEAS